MFANPCKYIIWVVAVRAKSLSPCLVEAGGYAGEVRNFRDST